MRTKWMIAMAVVVMGGAFIGSSIAHAESDTGVGGSAQANLDFQVNVPTVIMLRIGSAGNTIDTVSFSVTDIPENQPTINGDVQPAIQVGAIVANNATVTLTADSSTAMVGGATGDNMPFSVISTTGSNDFNGINGLAFNGTNNQQIWQATGRGNRTGQLTYTYANTYTYTPDAYTGQVTYTLSSP